jgi:serine/threonine protein phosphatase PrpC
MIAVDRSHRPIFGGTSTGLVRLQNEDRFVYAFYQTEGEEATPVILALVADGVGGQNAGEKAASITVDLIPDYFEKYEAGDLLKGLEDAILAANQEVMREAELDPALVGMACTCAATVLAGRRLFIANLGDSRIYLQRSGQLIQISRDHTWESESRHLGYGQQAGEKQKNQRSHIITRYLGSPIPPKVDIGLYLGEDEGTASTMRNQGLELGKDDRVLICSDGLTDMVTDEEINNIMAIHPANQLVEKLTTAALDKGGQDNITMVILGDETKG